MKRTIFAATAACILMAGIAAPARAGDDLWQVFWAGHRAPLAAPVPVPRPRGRVLGGTAEVRALVSQVARRVRVDVATAHAVVLLESNYRPSVRGAAGEYGLTQIKCPTARGIGFRGACSALLDPATNLHWGLTHLRLASGGSTACAYVARHNLGMYARPRCTAYGVRVVSLARQMGNQS
ncbi:transglycosylase SLT domain-containing protein [Phreatobacter sp. HK31-P]